MSTRAEENRYLAQRKHPAPADAKRERKRASKKALADHPSKRAGRKAVYALEEGSNGQSVSRKSTRKSANKSRNDQGYLTKQAFEKGSPEANYERDRVRRRRIK